LCFIINCSTHIFHDFFEFHKYPGRELWYYFHFTDEIWKFQGVKELCKNSKLRNGTTLVPRRVSAIQLKESKLIQEYGEERIDFLFKKEVLITHSFINKYPMAHQILRP
jgi:hypothetical protein